MGIVWVAALLAAEPDRGREFAETVRPFLATYCNACHGAANPAAQLNLAAYTTATQAIADHPRWALVAEKLASSEMPPKAMKQPSETERQRIVDWVETVRREEAAKNAGDPGVVLTRRLSNSEYNYAIRDLTGVDLRPAREFPVDPTNSDGFDNSGESLAMSPALLNKYLQAAREVSTHLAPHVDGVGFAPHPMLAESDREKYTIRRIVEFYERQPTDYAAYFLAAWRYKHRVALGAALGEASATLESIARGANVSPRYLPLVWEILETAPEPVGPVAKLQTMWRMLPPPDTRAAKQEELIREACAKMRDYVVKVRKLTAMQFRSPKVLGLGGTSQPLMNWKLRAYAANRRNFDRAALQVGGEPPLALPEAPMMRGVPSEDQVALRNAALAVRARIGDPDLLAPAGQRAAYEASFARFANVFPDAFFVKERGRFYPDDSEDKGRLLSAGFHNVMGYFRDDTPLMELILDEEGRRELDRLWLEFDTIGDQTTRTYVQFFFNQSGEIEGRGRESGAFRPGDAGVTSEKTIFGIRDAYLAKAEKGKSDEVALQAIRDHFARVNATIRNVEKARIESEPRHVESLLAFAARAYRRPLAEAEKDDLRRFYRDRREAGGLAHEDALREVVVTVLMAPDFCYRVETTASPSTPPAVTAKASAPKTTPLPGPALASRLSFFLWSSVPDEELAQLAAAGGLDRPETLSAQVRRMLKDPRSRALAVEFAGHWLDFRRFEDHASVDRTRFPTFTNDLRKSMFEEPVRFLDDLIRNDRSMLEALYGRHTFVDRALARHYGIEDLRLKPGEWTRIEDARPYGRGGVLPMAAFLTRNSPGLRTSPVKRGYWVAKTVLGERIPPPPPQVPELPDDEAKMDLPLRQALAKHRDNAACAGCHARFDGFGLAFEGYGPVGERRTRDLAGREVDARADFPGGSRGEAVDGLLAYIRGHREKDFVSNLCRKTLAYALGRGLQLSDEPLIERAQAQFAASGYKFSALIESIVASPQFRRQRNPEYLSKR